MRPEPSVTIPSRFSNIVGIGFVKFLWWTVFLSLSLLKYRKYNASIFKVLIDID